MVHRREIGGREVLFGNQGALWGNAMTWWDHETGSVWSQPLGEAIVGELKGSTIELLPSTLTQWDAWVAAHPETLAIDTFGFPMVVGLDDIAIVVEIGSKTTAYPYADVAGLGVVNDVVGGAEVAVVVDPGSRPMGRLLPSGRRGSRRAGRRGRRAGGRGHRDPLRPFARSGPGGTPGGSGPRSPAGAHRLPQGLRDVLA